MLDLALAIDVPPRWIPDLGGDVFKSDWEVDVVQVKILDSPVPKLLLDNGLDLLWVMERIPQLANEE